MNINFLLVTFLLTVVGVHTSFDWTNLDLVNFRYFKYPQTTQKPIFFKSHGHIYSIRHIPEKPSKFKDLLSRSKAVAGYFKDLALGREKERIKSQHIIDPSMGEKLRQHFEAKYGEHAEKLVEFLGTGPSHENLVRANVI